MVSNVKSSWPSYDIRRTRPEWDSYTSKWNASCCDGLFSYPFVFIEFSKPLNVSHYASKWMCEDCARKHGLIW